MPCGLTPDELQQHSLSAAERKRVSRLRKKRKIQIQGQDNATRKSARIAERERKNAYKRKWHEENLEAINRKRREAYAAKKPTKQPKKRFATGRINQKQKREQRGRKTLKK